jgi:cytochrome b pre-mRNA-processing protein 3
MSAAADFDLLPTFSTWAQVTMLHLYLLLVRLRCLDKPDYKLWEAQLIDHFFHDAEERMDLTHNISSRALRQRYLKDLFLQWRGLILAYDEGLVKGDAVLASAVWRNLFKGREDFDARKLAAVVGWMRMVLKSLDAMLDPALAFHAAGAFGTPPTALFAVVDEPAPELDQEQEAAALPKLSPAAV